MNNTTESVYNQLLTTKLSLIEGQDPGFIETQLSVPLKYMCSQDQECQIQVGVILPEEDELQCSDSQYYYQTVFLSTDETQTCLKKISDYPDTLKLELKASIDGLVDGTTRSQVMIGARVTAGEEVVYNDTIGSTSISIKDRDTIALCGSLIHPHMTTFDGTTYNVFREGEFVLYKHTTMPYE
ncbi:hypothetical protein LOTGIDRAFT_177009, partial [Lottia gigantea]